MELTGGFGSDPSNPIRQAIEDAVFELMKTTDVEAIKVSDVIHLAGVSRSTFYRNYKNVDDVVKQFEDKILENMHVINSLSLQARFSDAELDPTPTMIQRMEILASHREKILALNGPHGDPVFTHRATVFMHEHFRNKLSIVGGDEITRDLYLSFVLAGHNNLVQYWLEERPDLEPRTVAAALSRFMYAPFFLGDSDQVRTGKPLHFE